MKNNRFTSFLAFFFGLFASLFSSFGQRAKAAAGSKMTGKPLLGIGFVMGLALLASTFPASATIWTDTTTTLTTHVSTVALLAIGIGIAFVTVKIGWGIVKSFTR